MKVTAFALVAAVGFLGSVAVTASADENDPVPETVTVTHTETVRRLQSYQGRSARWWAYRTAKARREANARGHALRTSVGVGASGLERAFLCIHRFEGSWGDPNAPYWGGLQMDMSFMRSYGAEFLRAYGTANNWTPAMQIAVAARAYLSGRGFGPWPNTARSCGLL